MNTPGIVLLPGWSVAAAALAPLVRATGSDARALDLPGQGARLVESMPPTLDGIARRIERDLTDGVVLVGWSLGAMVALEIAAAGRVRPAALVLAAPTPKFVAAPDWAHGARGELLDRYDAAVRADGGALVAEFAALMLLGDARRSAGARQLREARSADLNPDALAAGLRILREADLRPVLAAIDLPTLVVAGGGDRVTPPAAARWIATSMQAATSVELASAGHALPVTHAAELGAAVAGFAARVGDGASA